MKAFLGHRTSNWTPSEILGREFGSFFGFYFGFLSHFAFWERRAG
jgi:hypothetical protein